MEANTSISRDLIELLNQYQGNVREILKEHPGLDYLYALSEQRENLLEWFPWKEGASLLQVGSDYGALTGLLSDRLGCVTVLDPDGENLTVSRWRHVQQKGRQNIRYLQGDLLTCQELRGQHFDYVALIGSLSEQAEAEIAAAKELLTKDGILILAVSNPFGVKYWAGSRPESRQIPLKTLKAMVNEEGAAARFYYPMPDYRIASMIYSDAMMPGKGELSDQMLAYDEPEVLKLEHIGEVYDAVCADGQFDRFANSYLLFWSPSGSLPELPVYLKYNRTRQETFQICTEIRKKASGERSVTKRALYREGTPHIRGMQTCLAILEQQHERLTFTVPESNAAGDGAVFPYVTGRSLTELYYEAVRRGEDRQKLLASYLDRIFTCDPDLTESFTLTDAFREVFGELPEETFAGERSLRVSDIDLVFDNILVEGDTFSVIDCEWTFSFPVPEEYIRYRILYYLYRRMRELEPDLAEESFLTDNGICAERIGIFRQMEEAFQQYVHGENQKIYLENYMYAPLSVEQLLAEHEELPKAQEQVRNLTRDVRERDTAIRKLNEVQRLTQNHVVNLEVTIKNQSHEINELGKTLTYLNAHQSLPSRLRRKLSAYVNEKYPKGSPKRRRLDYQREYLRHPIRSFRLYSTPEGKNLRDGDFEIGSCYREHGKLHFAHEEAPTVSIVIPVYNQIEYTYLCLVSILEYTKDVSYEVILADDVSTDATSHISDYAEGLVICRNSSNQGFLRNCNQAARAARGRYIMFLNNDTQVTAGWLSSLVKLIESDPTIGMVGSKLVYPDGRLQEAGGIIWSDASGWNYGRLDDPDKPEYNYVKDVDYISGAAILLPLQLWKQLGGFDTRFAPAYCEDSDLAFSVRKAGLRVVYQPLSKVIHFEGISNGTDVSGTGLKRYQVVNNKKFKEKWAAELAEQYENNGNPDPFRARERSKGKKIILVVDHYVPTFDKDAGSRTTWQYLKMFVKKGFIVKFVGDNFMHEEPYSTALEQLGIEILHGPAWQTGLWDWLEKHGDEISVAYLNRPHIAVKYIDFLKEHTHIKVIYYGHDLHFLRERREYELTGDPERKESSEYWRSMEMTLMGKADMSYYPSYVERDAIRASNPLIKVRDIIAYVYDSFREDLDMDFAKKESLLFVGGFAHPPNADAVLWFAKEIYPLIREQQEAAGQKPADFLVVGSKVTEEIKALAKPGNGIVIKGFVSDEELTALYRTSRLVVVPLRYGAGVKGKVIEALYNGAPILTTSIGAEGIADAETVMGIADGPEEFARKAADLYQDPERLAGMAAKTQDYIRSRYSLEAAWNVIREDFEV